MAFEDFIQVMKKDGSETLVQAEDLACFAYDASTRESAPKAVVFPKSTLEVRSILIAANEAIFYDCLECRACMEVCPAKVTPVGW